MGKIVSYRLPCGCVTVMARTTEAEVTFHCDYCLPHRLTPEMVSLLTKLSRSEKLEQEAQEEVDALLAKLRGS